MTFVAKLTDLGRQWVARWSNWAGDRDMEQAIRKALTQHGWRGQAARLGRVRLVAVQRPGWLQIYAFQADCEDQPPPPPHLARVFGLLRQDERFDRVDIRLFETASARRTLLEEWSTGLCQLRR